jgi:hypothetical protein
MMKRLGLALCQAKIPVWIFTGGISATLSDRFMEPARVTSVVAKTIHVNSSHVAGE